MKKGEIKILLVDDEPDVLEIVGYNLKNEGYQVKTAKNGLDALKSAKKHLPQLILLDVMMPEMDGIEACKTARHKGFRRCFNCLFYGAWRRLFTNGRL